MKIFNSLFFIIISLFSYSQCVSGDCENGFGKFEYDNESFYEGNWKNGLKHGRGLDYQFDSINRKTKKKAFVKKLGLFERNQLIEGNEEVFNGRTPLSFTVTYKSFTASCLKNANLYESPENTSNIIKSFEPGNTVFIVSKNTVNGYYYVIDPISGSIGYVNKSLIGQLKQQNDQKDQLLIPSGISESLSISEIKISNSTDNLLGVKIGLSQYFLDPLETKTITIEPGEYIIFAWQKGVNPYRKKQIIESGQNYERNFIIVYSD